MDNNITTEEVPHFLNLDDVKELQLALAAVDAMEEAKNSHKVRILCLSIWYPLSMSRYFERAMRRNPNIDLKTVGPFTGSWIPWMGGMNLPEKYAKPPDIPMFRNDVGRVDYEAFVPHLEGWKPDIVMAIDAGINWHNKPQDGVSVMVATDPHVGEQLGYPASRKIHDIFFNMQKCYSETKDSYLPYAFDPTVHFPEETVTIASGEETSTKDTDCVLIGMPYEQRVQWVNELRKHGVSVIFENAPVFDEYRALANRARIGLNWSSLNDLNARFFETPAFGLAMVTNRVPDAPLFLEENEDYLGFSTLQEAVEKVLYLKNNPAKLEQIANSGYRSIQPHTYDHRIKQILEECGFCYED